MVLAPFLFKAKAIQSLKGNWQTALLVSFFCGIMSTITSLVYSTLVPAEALNTILSLLYSPAPDLSANATLQALLDAMEAIPPSTEVLLITLSVLSFLINPMLQLGANHYFVSRLKGLELGFGGLFSRARYWAKALWLSILIGIKVFLWSLLLIVPGIIASIRYSMAYYYLAEDPSLSAWEALEKSKNAMRNTKMSYLALTVSFLGWMLMSMLLQTLLGSIDAILALVAYQFLELFIGTYMNGSFAAFFSAVSDPLGLQRLHRSAASMMGSPTGAPFGAWMGPQGKPEDPDLQEEDEEEAEEAEAEPSEGGPSQENGPSREPPEP